ncbi:NADPH-dependent FMN reductase [Deinococcus sp. PESE-13]
MKLLALSGSLRADSVNTALLRALAEAAPAGVRVELFDGLRDLPLFNPDDEERENAAVTAWRAVLRGADAVVISSPEYAHGIPGAFKNALDWVVGSAEFDGKPTLLLGASARPQHAPTQLAEVLRTMGARVQGPHLLDLPGNVAAAQAALRTPARQAEARDFLAALLP